MNGITLAFAPQESNQSCQCAGERRIVELGYEVIRASQQPVEPILSGGVGRSP
jgi:hypothetical protein